MVMVAGHCPGRRHGRVVNAVFSTDGRNRREGTALCVL